MVCRLGDRIAVGLYDGEIYVYKVEGYKPQAMQTITTIEGFLELKAQSAPLSPHLKLERLYQMVSNSTGYKALVLKGPFQRNVFYLTQLSSLADILIIRLNQFYKDLNSSLVTVKGLMNEEPTLNVVYKIMSLIQRAKADLALIKMLLSQADQMKEEHDGQQASCTLLDRSNENS